MPAYRSSGFSRLESYAALTRASRRIARSVLLSMDRVVKLDDGGRLAGFRRDLSAMCIEP
jgi:hypothetical protein